MASPPPTTAYEAQRAARIADNAKRMAEMGLDKVRNPPLSLLPHSHGAREKRETHCAPCLAS